MPITGKYFPSQEKEEKVFLLIRKHWFNYVIFFFLAILTIIPVLAVIIYWSLNAASIDLAAGNIIVVLTSIYVLFMLGIQLYGFIDYYLDVYIITDRRIVDITQDGMFRRSISELHLHQVQDVNAKVDGIFQTLFHFGDVYIQTAGERENFIFNSVPHPYSVAKQIVDLSEKHIQCESDNNTNQPNKYDDEGHIEKGLPSDTPTGSSQTESKVNPKAEPARSMSSAEGELNEGQEVDFE